ncbi:acyltransferase-like protein At1g54570, chloroplastic isoform X2 [Hibiscus syriacus]|uniref:acyltransferase-like protein At1g54570, chloroplastic isoform X2 n=1 Tax=Hibiscus syriacus TaxID=106335 RepID=UPI0019205741|nr:acyltransferase-like protein At1g54570, chloroplastic isoform X2 [Hibiscus syriacus]
MVKNIVSEELELFWDDGYGTNTVKDYIDAAKDMIKPDGGPPRWFCPVECGRPIKDSPLLLFLPGLDGVGMGLILHHKPLGKVFEVQCLHIPVNDRTPFEGLVKLVEEAVRIEHASHPKSPIYLVGDSIGGCLALAVAARNPSVDLVMILVNPATSFASSQLQQSLPVLEAFPDGLHVRTIPFLLSLMIGEPLKMAKVGVEARLLPTQKFEKVSSNLTALLPFFSGLPEILPKETLLWKLKLLKSASAYTNSRLHAVKAEVLVIASDKDHLFPSRQEALRLKKVLPNCIVRIFKDNGHALLFEDCINLLTIIKGTCIYRHSSRHDFIKDFLPPSIYEYKCAFDDFSGILRFLVCTTMFSTMEDGKIVGGLAGVPDEGPVLLVGDHMLLGMEINCLAEAFLREKKIMIRGMSHPELFGGNFQKLSTTFNFSDWLKVMGAMPVSPKSLFKALSANSHVLLYPGGAREALHHKGEQYKLFWPDQPEFVRFAAQFGATIVPFGVVGEDDIVQMLLDYNDYMKIPIVNDKIKEAIQDGVQFRDKALGEVASQEIFIPALLPKIPGRIYFVFGKPMKLKGRDDLVKNREAASEVYLQVKSEVEHCIDYLLKKREEDPFRNIFNRMIYRTFYSPLYEVPSFKP